MRIRSAGTAALLALVVISPMAASAQTVDELITRHIDARGGHEKLKAIQTLKITRTVATPFTSVKMTIFKKRPDLIRWEQTPQGQTVAVPRAINATGAWDTNQGKVVARPEALANEAREIDGDFDGLLVDWKAKGHVVTLEGREAGKAGEPHTLKVATRGGAVRYVYLDSKTYLETRQTGRVSLGPDPKTQEMRFNEVAFTYSDWRDVNGVKFPFAVDEDRTGGGITQSFAIYTEKIEVNVPMDDALFALPGSK